MVRPDVKHAIVATNATKRSGEFNLRAGGANCWERFWWWGRLYGPNVGVHRLPKAVQWNDGLADMLQRTRREPTTDS